jgi:hypothetical protein
MESPCSLDLRRLAVQIMKKTLDFPGESVPRQNGPEALAQHLLQQRQMCV